MEFSQDYQWSAGNYSLKGSVRETEVEIDEAGIMRVFGFKIILYENEKKDELTVMNISPNRIKVENLLSDMMKYKASWKHIGEIVDEFLID